ncbi:MAG: hypothetical protein AMJ69_08920 [Gammaproteobacteria bacterium SG8_47]|nr:MAG: hypothetical protein AMJ69_08920 [Gammaproteobacteria bacterium SG8_47]
MKPPTTNIRPERIVNHKPRYQIVDAARGLALLLMVVYHFFYDLEHVGFAQFAFSRDPFWIGFRSIIVTMFLAIVGVSLYLAQIGGRRWPSYWRRLLVLLTCAALVSLVSWWLFAERFIYFGILHFIAVASVLGLAFVPLGTLNLVVGAALIVVGVLYAHPTFDQRGLQWVGLMTHRPATEDYVPLLPWFGVVLVGLGCGKTLARSPRLAGIATWQTANPLGTTLAWSGRHSLAIYMLHQPLLLGLLYGLRALGARLA